MATPLATPLVIYANPASSIAINAPITIDGQAPDWTGYGTPPAAGTLLSNANFGKALLTVYNADGTIAATNNSHTPIQNIPLSLDADLKSCDITITEGLATGIYNAQVWYLKNTSGTLTERFFDWARIEVGEVPFPLTTPT